MRTRLAAVAALCVATFTVAPVEAATATLCTQPLFDTTTGRLVVPAGATCTLDNLTVDGGIRVWDGASLFTQDRTVHRSVMGRRAATVKIIDTDVVGTGASGNINLAGTRGRSVIGSEGCAVEPSVGKTITLQGNHRTIGAFHNTVGNPFVVQHNDAVFIRIRHNRIGLSGGGSLLVHNNTTTGNIRRPNGLRLYGNHSHNGFSCAGNDDAPVGSGNSAVNGMSGQCVGLA